MIVPDTTSAHLQVTFETATTGSEAFAPTPLINLALQAAGATAAFLYNADPMVSRLTLKVATGAVPASSIGRLAVEFSGERARLLRGLRTAADIEPLSDPIFEKFPEVLQYRFGRLLVTPLIHGDRLLGLLNIGRISADAFQPGDSERISALAHALAAPLATEFLQAKVRVQTAELTAALERVSELEKKLEERKLIERAKGILQEQGATEEAAYMSIRQTSRQRRILMSEVAREIIAGKTRALRMTA